MMRILEIGLVGGIVAAIILIGVGVATNTTSDVLPLLIIISLVIAVISFVLSCTRRSQRDVLLWAVFLILFVF